jgi:hypothetical protein
MSLVAWLVDLLAGGKQRRLHRALTRLETPFAPTALEGDALDRAAGIYHHTLRLTLRVAPSQASARFRCW